MTSFNGKNFSPLFSRLVPCGPGPLLIAIDLSHNFVFWNSQLGLWDLTPTEDRFHFMAQVREWKTIAWDSVQELRLFFDKGANSQEGSAAYDRFKAIQYTWLRTQKMNCAWANGWLYRSLCLDHRWLLHETDVPLFDEHVFSIMLLQKPGTGGLDRETQASLQLDPIVAAMPSLHDMIFPESWRDP